jgi:magnesium-transporting ATPase (P-type)
MQDFKSNETQLFKNVEKLQKESAGAAGAKKKGGMKEAADSAEQIRKWEDHMWDVKDLEKNLGTSIDKGLTDAQAAEVFKTTGENTLTEKGKTPWYIVFLHE